jgi:hypothetical protein
VFLAPEETLLMMPFHNAPFNVYCLPAAAVRFTKYYYGDQIKEDVMDRARSTHGRDEKNI